MRFVNSNLARKIGKHYGWRQKFFGRRYRAIQVSDEEAAQIDRLRYLLAQGVKENLVRSPLDWPGVHCAWPLANGKWQLDGWWDDQTAAYRACMRGEKTKRNEFRETETLTLSPLSCWQHRSQEAIRNDVRALVEDLEAEAKASGRPVLGVRKILRQNPTPCLRRPRTSPHPTSTLLPDARDCDSATPTSSSWPPTEERPRDFVTAISPSPSRPTASHHEAVTTPPETTNRAGR